MSDPGPRGGESVVYMPSLPEYNEPPQLHASMALPCEIIQHVFNFLSPFDFNAARHTCRSWMQASLDYRLLSLMLKRGGWWSGAFSNLWSCRNFTPEEWHLSRYFARQCALSAGWTGNGLHEPPYPGSEELDARPTSLTECCQADFADLATGYGQSTGKQRPPLIFSVSVCGRFLLVAEAGMVYVYALEEADVRPITSIMCPRKVLAVSMDYSASRFAIAMLLEGRMGLVCDLDPEPDPGSTANPVELGDFVENSASHRTTMKISTSTARGYLQEIRANYVEQNAEHCAPAFDTISVRNGDMDATLQDISGPVRYIQSFINQTWNEHIPASLPTSGDSPLPCAARHRLMPISTGPRTIYRHLCSEDDPPRSVALCPQKQCVAFGCAGGIELHWIDKQTSQDLHRWFPVSSPSDFLFFLNPRPGVDSTHKLRIISSVAHPDERPSIHEHFSQYVYPAPFTWAYRNAGSGSWRRTAPVVHDHYRAVPLSDGCHHLFIDPTSSLLYLGSDAPLGGLTKLIRKVALLPPKPRMIPSHFTVDANLSEGAHVAACFRFPRLRPSEDPATDLSANYHGFHQPESEAILMLYSIPSDLFSTDGCGCSDPSSSGQRATSCANNLCLEWWPYSCDYDDDGFDGPDPSLPRRGGPWPLKLQGIELGKISTECAALAVNETPELTIWAIMKDGKARAWVVGGAGGRLRMRRRMIAKDGMVVDMDENEAKWDDNEGIDCFGAFDDFDGEYAERMQDDCALDDDTIAV